MTLIGLPGAIIQDRVYNSSQNISASAVRFAETIRHQEIRRLAINTSRVDLIVAALLACQEENCQVLLLRKDLPLDSALWREWKVDGILNADGSIKAVNRHRGIAEKSNFEILIATSGTTGIPKIASHTLSGLLGLIKKPNSEKSTAIWLTTYHPASFAGMQVLLSCLVGAGTIVAFTQWTVPQLCHAAREYSVTHISATPTFWRAFAIAIDNDISKLNLKYITLGGEVADQSILTRLRKLFPNAVITHIYALTETGALFAVRDGRAGFPAKWLETGVGNVKLRLRNDILEVLSPRAMKGYVNVSNTTSFTDDGWLITNDLLEIKDHRALFKGRADSIINVGGAKVSPEEVEMVLLEHPDVVEAAVFGSANPITGATVVAQIVSVQGADEATLRLSLNRLASSHLESYKVPRLFYFVKEIKLTDTGKKNR